MPVPKTITAKVLKNEVIKFAPAIATGIIPIIVPAVVPGVAELITQNLDCGRPDSVYGGLQVIDCGGV